jgi:hypothetical protein
LPDYELCEEDFNACNTLGADECVWDGVTEETGLRWRGNDLSAAIVFGQSEAASDFAP